MNIKETINSPEGRTLEFKRQVPEKLDAILRTVIAFSNGSGGEIIKTNFFQAAKHTAT